MTRRSFKMAILGLVGFTAFSAIAYYVVTFIINIACRAFLYMLNYPERSLVILGAIALVIQIAHAVYYKVIKK